MGLEQGRGGGWGLQEGKDKCRKKDLKVRGGGRIFPEIFFSES